MIRAEDVMDRLFDEMCNERLRIVIEGEHGDVDVSVQDAKGQEVGNGHGESALEALADAMERLAKTQS